MAKAKSWDGDLSLTQEEWNRLWSTVDQRGPDQCWFSTRKSKVGSGYPAMKIRRIHKANLPLSRLIWTRLNGTIPDGLFVLHKCDNPPCCNPNHFFLGTHRDNMIDKSQKGRNPGNRRPKGNKNG